MNNRLGELISAVGPEAEAVLQAILVEYLRARAQHPAWPTDPVHASAVLAEESGELMQAALDFCYGKDTHKRHMMLEAVQCGAMSIRFLKHIKEYTPKDDAE
jgi:hypothetical protein